VAMAGVEHCRVGHVSKFVTRPLSKFGGCRSYFVLSLTPWGEREGDNINLPNLYQLCMTPARFERSEICNLLKNLSFVSPMIAERGPGTKTDKGLCAEKSNSKRH
jgi:hypothetical protein